jgi:hypothetical protein
MLVAGEGLDEEGGADRNEATSVGVRERAVNGRSLSGGNRRDLQKQRGPADTSRPARWPFFSTFCLLFFLI